MLNIVNLSYLLFRLSPLIIVSFFVLQSFLFWNLRGVMYLCGILITTFITIMTSPVLKRFCEEDSDEKSLRCNIITLGENGEYYSKIPLNLVVYSYTLFYLVVFIINSANVSDKLGLLNANNLNANALNTAAAQNVPILIFFPLLIIIESCWIFLNQCLCKDTTGTLIHIIVGILLGGIGGVIWALIITSLKIPQLQYIVYSNENVCSRPTKSIYRCKPKAN